MKNKNKKTISLFLIFVLVLLIFTIQNVQSATVSTCQWTNDNHFCVQSSDDTFAAYNGCRDGYKNSFQSVDQVPACKTGTCVPNGPGACLSNKYKVECEHSTRGIWHDLPLQGVEACTLGCCNVANSLCAIQTKKVCIQDLANGDANAFTSTITDQLSCDNSCRQADVGCCVQGSDYTYKTRSLCSGTFYNQQQCSDIPGYPAVSHKYKSCGKPQGEGNIENNEFFDVYWYDSNNKREDLAQRCNTPGEPITSKCEDPDGLGGKDAYCKSTNCVDECPDCDRSQLRTGESVCLNVLNTFYGNDKKSTGLHNQILRCQYGIVSADSSDRNRELRCNEVISATDKINAGFVPNKYSSCASCGSSGSSFDTAAFFPAVGPPIAAGALFGFGNACYGKGEGWTLGIGDVCENQGDCTYDKDFIWSPIGSCNPKYPIDNTNKCGECGKGGDAGVNLCTRNECNSLGDCQFNKKFVTSESLIASGGLALGSCVAGWAAVPIFCSIPIVGQSACGPTGIGANNFCINMGGKNAIFWALQGLVVGVGASAATADNYEPAQDVMINNKIKLSVAMATANGILENLSEYDKNLSSGLSSGSYGRDTPTSGLISISSGLTTASAVYIRNTLTTIHVIPSGTNHIFTTGTGIVSDYLRNSIDTFLPTSIANRLGSLIASSLAKTTFVLTYVSAAPSFESGTCTPETPNTDNSLCTSCGAGEAQWYCTKERCDILGGAYNHCLFVTTNQSNGKAYGKCLPKDSKDITSPEVTKIQLLFMDNTRSFALSPLSNENKIYEITQQIKWNITTIGLNITTNEIASCTYSPILGTAYNGPDSSSFGEIIPGLYHYDEINITEADKVNGIKYYFKCKDVNGNSPDPTDDDSYVSFKFEPRPDEYPPVLDSTNPMAAALVPESITSVELTVIAYDGETSNGVNECKYTNSNESINYDDYEGTFTSNGKTNCAQSNSQNCYKFTKNLDLNSLKSTEIPLAENQIGTTPKIIQLKLNCKDFAGNIMDQPQDWSITRKSAFNITINNPLDNEQIYTKNILINVTTSDYTICNYTLDSNNYYEITKLPNLQHVIRSNINLSAGSYTLGLQCIDYARNSITSTRQFGIVVDNQPPNIIRLYKNGDQLCVQLDEKAQSCKYLYTPTSTLYDDGNLMIERSNNAYCAKLDSKTYYLACRDIWDNEMSATIYP